MDLASTYDRHDGIAGLLHPQAAFHPVGMVLGQAQGILVAQEIRRVQHERVQYVALDPLAAVQQAAQLT
jgi:hypothetical protein